MTRLEKIQELLEQYPDRQAILLNAHIGASIYIWVLDGEFDAERHDVVKATKNDIPSMLEAHGCWLGFVEVTFDPKPHPEEFCGRRVMWKML